MATGDILKKILIKLGVEVDGQDDVKGLNDSLGELGEHATNLPGPLGEVGESVGGVVGAIQKMTAAAKAFIATPLGQILAGIALALATIKAAFSQSAAGQDKFAKGMAVVSSIGKTLLDLLADIGNILIDLFTHPIDSIKKLGKSIEDFIMVRFNDVKTVILDVGQVMDDVFHGRFKKALEDGKKLTKDYAKTWVDFNPVGIVVKGLVKIGEKIKENADRAAKVQEMKNEADRQEIEFNKKKLSLEDEIARGREEAADKDNNTAKQRQKYAADAIAANKKLYEGEISLAKQRAAATHLELDWRKERGIASKEELEELDKVDAAVSSLNVEYENSNRTLEKAQRSVNKEIASSANAVIKAGAEIAKKQKRELEKATEGSLSEFDKQRQAAKDENEDELDSLKDQLKSGSISREAYNKGVATQAKILSAQLLNIKKDENKEEEKTNNEKLKKAEEDANKQVDKELKRQEKELDSKAKAEEDVENTTAVQKLQIEQNLINQKAALEAKALKDKYDAELELDKKLRIDTTQLTQDYADAKKDIDDKLQADLKANAEQTAKAQKKQDEDVNKAKVQLAEASISSIQSLEDAATALHLGNAKENFEINKALQLSSAVIAGIQGSIAAFTSAAQTPVIGSVLAPIAAAAAGVAAAANIAKIAATKFNSTSTGGASSTGSAGSAPSVGNFTPQTLKQISGQSGFQNPSTPSTTNIPNGNKNDVSKVYVTATDISTSQDKAATLKRRASFN